MNPSELRQAFPSLDSLQQPVKRGIMSIYHSAAHLSTTTLPMIAAWLASVIEDPPHSIYWYGPDEPKDLARQLRVLANEIDQASTAIDAAKPFWTNDSDTEGPRELRPDAGSPAQSPQTSTTGPT